MNTRTKIRREDGAAAVEFALIVGVLVMLIFGMLQFGLAFFQLQNLRAATREGARAGAVGATEPQVRQRVADSSLDSIDPANPAILVQYSYDASVNSPAWVAGVCPPTSDPNRTLDAAIRVSINLNDSGLPQGLKDIFTVNIPLLPPISLLDAKINGQFRCEGA